MPNRIALAQMCSDIVPEENAKLLRAHIGAAAAKKADIVFTPEMTGMLDRDRKRASAHIRIESEDIVLKTACESAAESGIWLSLGSLALKSSDSTKSKWVNRSFLIDPMGDIVARYDKIHLFDVDLETGESWRESSVYQPGDRAVIASVEDYIMGLSICYDLRFSALYASLSEAGAQLISVPSAFTVPTGRAHWEVMLRARAIESGSFVVAAAQCGTHRDGRVTYGHSMVVDPWGEILLDMGEEIGIAICDIDLERVAQVRSRVPSLANRRSFELPETKI